MKNLILFFLTNLFNYNSFSQNKIDTNNVIITDDYSNYHTYENAINQTIISNTPPSIKYKMEKSYEELIHEADSLLNIKNYKRAVITYEVAFKGNGNQGRISHRINAAICYTLLSNFDGAFIQLFRIAEKGKYTNNFALQENHLFDPLHSDKRWDKVIDIVLHNKRILEKQLTQQFIIPDQK